MKQHTACFTGHRPQKLPWGFNEADPRCEMLKRKLKFEIECAIQRGYRYFITGMALGVDFWAAEAVMELKEKYPHIHLEAAIPFEEQAKSWSEDSRDRYFAILEACDKVTLLSYHFHKDCYYKRNMYMLQKSSLLIAVYNGRGGGTGWTVAQAEENKISTVIINF